MDSPGISYFLNKLHSLFLAGGSQFSLTSLTCALIVALGFLIFRRLRRNRRVRLRTLVRAMFPRRIRTSRSSGVDLAYWFFNVFVYGLVLGWAVLSFQVMSNGLIDGLVGLFGPRASMLPEWPSRVSVTLAMFLAYELGYWFHHYLSHRVPFMWEFHKVHHTAEVLTPLTTFRVHPGDTLIFANILAIVTAFANGLSNYLLGETTYQYALSGTNLILVVFIHTYVHLQHTHVWIAFRGALGRILLSPAHHQVHHSTNPIHFNKNLGSCLALWDWLFGTLHIPQKEPEKLTFGVDEKGVDPHTIREGLFAPFWRAAQHFKPMFQDPPPVESEAAADSAVQTAPEPAATRTV